MADQKLRTLIVEVKAKIDELKQIGPEGEKAASKLSKSMEGAQAPTSKLSLLQAELKSKLQAMVPGASQATGALEKLGVTAESAGASLAVGLAAGAVVAGAAMIGLGVKAEGMFEDLVRKVDDFQDVVGTSAESSSRLVEVFEQFGISSETATNAMFKLSKATTTNEAGLAKLGIQVANNADGSTNLEETLYNVVKAYNATEDAATKNQIAFTAFGKSGNQLIDVLEVGEPRLRSFANSAANIITQEDIDNVKEMNRQQTELNQRAESLGVSFGRILVPVKQAMLGVADVGISYFFPSIKQSAEGMDAASSSARDLATQLANEDEELRKNAELTQTAADRVLGLADAHLRVQESASAVTRATADYSDAVKKNGANSQEAKDAQLALQRAVLSEAQAMIAAAKQDADAQVAKDGLTDSTQAAEAKINAERASLEKLIPTLAPGSPLRSYLEQYIQQLRAVPTSITTTLTTVSLSGRAGGNLALEGRAGGGPVLPNSIYRVGEYGPEWLVMGPQGGYVVPSAGPAPMPATASAPVVNQYIQGSGMNPDQVALAMNRRLARAFAT